jgi:hypothetical protein
MGKLLMKYLLLAVLMCFLPILSFAQFVEGVFVKPNLSGVAFVDFVKDVEAQHPMVFYFNKSWVDSVIVKGNGAAQKLTVVLDEAFKNTKLSYVIDGSNIILTNNYKVQTALSDGFFVNKSQNVPVESKESLSGFAREPEKKVGMSSSGNVVIGNPHNVSLKDNCLISGIVRHKEDGQPVVGAVVYIKELNIGSVTDASGYYALEIPKGKSQILFKSVGLENTIVSALVYNKGSLNVDMNVSAVFINEVLVTADRENNVKNLSIGVQQLNMEKIKHLPSTLGEVDILKTALLLPGVQTVGEGASGFNVRGGSADQNLMLFDQIPIFNTSHLFGFFSVFNPETIDGFKLYKSGIPANYGGRVSSVFDVQGKQGSLEKYSLSGGISPITSKLTFEGPLDKDKFSFIVGGRSTYSDWILRKIDSPQTKNSTANFFDYSAKLHYRINDKNELSMTAYHSKDNFSLNSDASYHFENRCMRLFFKHHFSPKMHSKTVCYLF